MVLRFTYFGWLVCLLAVLAGAQAKHPAPDINGIVQRMAAAQQENRARLRPFTVKRGYFLLDKKDQTKGQVVADASPGKLTELMKLPDLESVFAQLVRQTDTEQVARDLVAVMKINPS